MEEDGGEVAVFVDVGVGAGGGGPRGRVLPGQHLPVGDLVLLELVDLQVEVLVRRQDAVVKYFLK